MIIAPPNGSGTEIQAEEGEVRTFYSCGPMDSCVSRDEYVWILLSVGAKQELLKQLGHLKPVPQKIESVTKIT